MKLITNTNEIHLTASDEFMLVEAVTSLKNRTMLGTNKRKRIENLYNKLKPMKKALLILLMIASLTSVAQSLLLTENTTLQGNQYYSTVRTNGYNLDIADGGSLSVASFIMLNKGSQDTGGTITAANINVGSNVFFFSDGGTLKSTGNVTVGLDVKGIGTVIYCTNFNSLLIDDSVQVIQDCTLSLPKPDFDFDKATPIYYIDISGRKTNNLQFATGLYIAVYELNGMQASRKELWKQGILINKAKQ